MTKKTLSCARYVENFNPPHIIESIVHKVCESVADAFLGQITYGRDYVLRTKLDKEDWADGFGTKYTYSMTFDELVRCRDCKHYIEDPYPIDPGWPMMCDDSGRDMLEPDGYCAWGEKRDV